MRSKLRFALALSAALVVAPAFTGKALAAPDQTLGMAIMSAYVEVNGSLLDGAGVVTSAYLGSGQYAVQFNRPLAGCVSTATQWGNANAIISVQPNGDTVTVRLAIPESGAPLQRPFQMIVFCAR